MALCLLALLCAQPVRAAPELPGLPTPEQSEPLTPGDNAAVSTTEHYNELLGGAIRILGYIVAGWGVFSFGRSFPAHDPSQRINGFLFIVSGLILALLPRIVRWVIGG